MKINLFPATRPYWHVDAKWVCSIFFALFLSVCLILLTLTKITDEKRAPTIGALIIGTGFIRGNTVDTEEARQALAEHGGVIRPLPNVPSVTITEADLKLTPGQIAIKVFKPLTDSIYNEGIDKTADRFAANPEQKEKFKKDASIFNAFTKTTHQKFLKFFRIFAGISLVLALGVIYFSAGFGRLSNLGALLIVITLPGTLLSLGLTHPPKDGSGGGLGALPPELGTQLGQAVGGTYTKLTVLGVILLVAAAAGKIVNRIRKHSSKTSPQK